MCRYERILPALDQALVESVADVEHLRRAPELFDVPSDATIDERTDIFSLGATLYAMAFCRSPWPASWPTHTQSCTRAAGWAC